LIIFTPFFFFFFFSRLAFFAFFTLTVNIKLCLLIFYLSPSLALRPSLNDGNGRNQKLSANGHYFSSAFSATKRQEDLQELSGFATTSLTDKDDGLVGLEDLQELILLEPHW
jgi:hypothetical protein